MVNPRWSLWLALLAGCTSTTTGEGNTSSSGGAQASSSAASLTRASSATSGARAPSSSLATPSSATSGGTSEPASGSATSAPGTSLAASGAATSSATQAPSSSVESSSAAATSAPPSSSGPAQPPVVASTLRGFLNIGGPRPDYEYGPAIILENGRYHAYYCSSPTNGGWDTIRMATSDDGMNWATPTNALIPQGPYGRVSVCDPTVVKHHGTYFMYVTCINPTDPPDGYQNNRICLALADSADGPFAMYPVPVIEDVSCAPHDTNVYCVGQPSAVMVGDTTYLYYTETQPGAPGRIYLQQSTDGLHFTPANSGASVWDRYNVDVKYDRGSQQFFLVQGEVDTRIITWASSADGISFSPYDAQRTILSNPDLPAASTSVSNNNPGLAGDERGTFNGMTFAVYGSSYPVTGDPWGHWHLYRSDVVVNPATADCSQCVANSCDDGCQKVLGTPATGQCVNPGAAAGAPVCCACQAVTPEADCHACAAGCVAACQGAGFSVGTCAVPGSVNQAACCACD